MNNQAPLEIQLRPSGTGEEGVLWNALIPPTDVCCSCSKRMFGIVVLECCLDRNSSKIDDVCGVFLRPLSRFWEGVGCLSQVRGTSRLCGNTRWMSEKRWDVLGCSGGRGRGRLSLTGFPIASTGTRRACAYREIREARRRLVFPAISCRLTLPLPATRCWADSTR